MSNQPFAPITAQELEAAVDIFRNEHGDEHAVFASSGLLEPTKEEVRGGTDMPRIVRFLGSDSIKDGGFEADVDVSNAKVRSGPKKNAQVRITFSTERRAKRLKLRLARTAEFSCWMKRSINVLG